MLKFTIIGLLFISCATTKDTVINPAIICPDSSKHRVLFCNCFVEARTVENNKSRYLFIPCPRQDGRDPNALISTTEEIRATNGE